MQSNPERDLALNYAHVAHRRALHALFQLDDALGQVLRTTTEPVIGQIRLRWWHDALLRLDQSAPPAQPVLMAMAADVLPGGVSGATLGAIVEGWEALIDAETVDEAAMLEHAEARGARLFRAGAALLGPPDDARVALAGRGWALDDLSRHLREPAAAERARALAGPLLRAALVGAWPSPLRSLGALTHLARMNLASPSGRPVPIGAPRRIARLMAHRMTGR